MIRLIIHLITLILLFTIQVSFIHALPYPFDRIPFVLVVVVYLYQYANRTASWWWLVCYGLLLDILSISLAPLETISYTLATASMMFLVAHVFTNRSFYGMGATAVLSLSVLTISELSLLGLSRMFTSFPFLWKTLLSTNLWSAFFACFLLLFVFSSLRRARSWLQIFFLDRV
ncbi:MAG: hypothetical protein UY76_C0049G0002 [Candidatus Uhrbacteria bacterium GW2011_GWA2_52_8d]|uniref:Rod shape-determining protein MreD n=1 Tax=Candidatus Uhrbacteria bacterium GW2011_GWA2_52_8d TaxID=1618979 RepID=A0A0G1XLT5_9BACT|nr:MAG: hypothetical protein UY76_C0049G0002 [Candidatus Uhrbacteria bacterium GW2011_GWA2_52_8d]